MGVAFRFGGYTNRVIFGGRTIKDGECAAIWNRVGEHTQIIGPRRVFLFCSTIRFLDRHKAEENQYLRISHRDGRVESIRGGVSMYHNPALHDNISVHDAIRLDSSSDCIIVYRDSFPYHKELKVNELEQSSTLSMDTNDTKDISEKNNYQNFDSNGSRRIVRGPVLFFPEPNEHVHTFSWSSNILNSSSNNDDKFHVLQTSNLSMTLKLKIATNDNFFFYLHLFIGYHVESLEKLLLIDPMSKIHQGLLADAHSFGDTFSSQSIRECTGKGAVTEKLGKLDAYPHLRDASQSCGFRIDSLRVTGISVCEVLEKQICDEQKLAASLRVDLTKKTEGRKMRELELEDERNRVEEEKILERMKVTMTDKLDEESHQIKLAALDRKFELEKKKVEAETNIMQIKDRAVLKFLKDMEKMGVDMTKFLTSTKGTKTSKEIIERAEILNCKKLEED